MTNLLYVVVPFAFAILVAMIWTAVSALTARGRSRRSLEGGIAEFSRELTALSQNAGRDDKGSWRDKGR